MESQRSHDDSNPYRAPPGIEDGDFADSDRLKSWLASVPLASLMGGVACGFTDYNALAYGSGVIVGGALALGYWGWCQRALLRGISLSQAGISILTTAAILPLAIPLSLMCICFLGPLVQLVFSEAKFSEVFWESMTFAIQGTIAYAVLLTMLHTRLTKRSAC